MALVTTDESLLAVNGGAPVCSTPFPAWPWFGDEEIAAAGDVLRSGRVNYWTGDEGRRFEEEFAEFTKCKYAVALANGTVALEAALRAREIGPGDEVIVTSRSFIASVSCVVAVGATPVFADVDRVSQNLSSKTIAQVAGSRTKAIIVVHLAGWPCDMDAIMAFAESRGIVVIEDCAQSHGASYRGRPVGSLGHVATFSFCQDKILTTGGEGGMLTTDDRQTWERVWALRDHGKSYDAVHHRDHPPGFRWLHESFGTNWRMTEMQSAIGRKLLKRSPGWVERRREHAATLEHAFGNMPALRVTPADDAVYHSYYKYYVFVRPEGLRDGWDRDRIMAAVMAEGVPCYSGSCSEIYLESAFEGTGFRPAEPLGTAVELGETSLMFLVHPTLSDEDMAHTCRAVEKVMDVATA